MSDCVFCGIVAGDAAADIIRETDDTVAFVPLNPVVPGHVLVVPKVHVDDALDDPGITAATMRDAAFLAGDRSEQCNLITSVGPLATQTVFHLHIHIVPRRAQDGLGLPWTGQAV